MMTLNSVKLSRPTVAAANALIVPAALGLMGMKSINGLSLYTFGWIVGSVVFFVLLVAALSFVIHRDPAERGRYRQDAGDNAVVPFENDDD